MISTSETEEAGGAFGEIIRKHIEDLHIPNRDNEASEYMTVSAGVVMTTPNEISDIDALMKIVDKRLYAAKDLGRNKVVSADEYRES